MANNAINVEYAKRRARALDEAAKRRIEAEEQIPELKKQRGRAAALRAHAAAEAISNGGEAQNALDEYMRALPGIQKKLLEEAGFPPDYLEPVFTCPLCEDTGYVGEGAKRLCSCYRAHLAAYGPGGLDKAPEFSAFDEECIPEGKQRESALKIKAALQDFAANYPALTRRNLLLYGETGLGKSFLLGCTASAIKKKGMGVKFLTAYKLFELFRQQHMGQGEHMGALVDVDFLVIDDLGTEPMFQNITINYLFALLNERSVNKKGTAIATNIGTDKLIERYGERIVSRMLDTSCTQLIRLSGADLRRYAVKRQSEAR